MYLVVYLLPLTQIVPHDTMTIAIKVETVLTFWRPHAVAANRISRLDTNQRKIPNVVCVDSWNASCPVKDYTLNHAIYHNKPGKLVISVSSV